MARAARAARMRASLVWGAWGARASRALAAFGVDVLDAMLDRACPGCGGAVPRGRPVCDACDGRVPRSGSVFCLRCMQERPGQDAPGDAGPERASPAAGSGCARHGAARLLVAGPRYEPPLDRVVHAFKYSGAREAHTWIADLLPEPPGRGTAIWREYILVPVPLHPARLTWRGFDQARLLAETAGSRWGIPAFDALRRRRDHPPQARLGADRRRDNVRDAFTLTGSGARLLASRPVLLVDDVATTGSTLLEAASALEMASPSWILSLAAAHGGLPGRAEPASAASVAGEGRV